MKSMKEKIVAKEKEMSEEIQKHNSIKKKNKGYLIAKRVFDIVTASVGLLLSIIPIAIIALLIKLDSPGPVFYSHHRIGKKGKDFYLLKFRSMHINAEEMVKNFTPEQKAEWESNFKLEHDPRVTRIGHFLRRSSLDELPQFINILKGELSVVGPRPIVQEELDRYGENKEKFLSVTPGLTGYWQAYARSTCTYEQRMEMELFYVEKANFWWDIKIVFATIGAVFRGIGAQ